MGRKNFLFMNTPGGAEASAVIYSVIETAKVNEQNPYRYLCHIFHTAPTLDHTALDWIAPLRTGSHRCSRRMRRLNVGSEQSTAALSFPWTAVLCFCNTLMFDAYLEKAVPSILFWTVCWICSEEHICYPVSIVITTSDN